MTDIDHEGLRAWYRSAMRERVAELEAIRSALVSGEQGSRSAVRALGQSLRGSGGSFGFPEVTEMGEILEEGSDRFLFRHVEGALILLRTVAWPDDPARQQRHAWLAAAAGAEMPGLPELPELPEDLDGAWAAVSAAAGMGEEDLARHVAEYFSLEVADLDRTEEQARRLVPPSTCAEWGILPLAEDDIHVRVATADPTNLNVEARLRHLTGRIPLFEVTPPMHLREAMARTETGPEPIGRPASAAEPATGPVTVLVVDDDRGARLIASTVLARKGYGVAEAKNGAEALELTATRPDIRMVVADLEMPVMSGLELLRILRGDQATAHLPVVVLTGSEDTLTEASLIEEGADDYIRKPLDPRLFLARVSATLRRAGR